MVSLVLCHSDSTPGWLSALILSSPYVSPLHHVVCIQSSLLLSEISAAVSGPSSLLVKLSPLALALCTSGSHISFKYVSAKIITLWHFTLSPLLSLCLIASTTSTLFSDFCFSPLTFLFVLTLDCASDFSLVYLFVHSALGFICNTTVICCFQQEI